MIYTKRLCEFKKRQHVSGTRCLIGYGNTRCFLFVFGHVLTTEIAWFSSMVLMSCYVVFRRDKRGILEKMLLKPAKPIMQQP